MERWRLPVEDTPLEDCTESVLRHWDCLPDLDQSEVSTELTVSSTNHSSPGLQIVAGDGDTRHRGPRPSLVPAQPLVNARVFAILLLKQKLN